jgi:competence protein ComEC
MKRWLPLLIVLVCVGLGLLFNSDRGPRLVVLDVGQGDALYVRTPAGQDLLIDAGPGRQVIAELERELPAGDRTLEAIFATHMDADHIGGFEAVLQEFKVLHVFTNGQQPTTKKGHAFIDAVNTQGIELQELSRGQRLTSTDFTMDVLWPDDSERVSSNEGALVMRLVTAEKSFLLMADAPDSVEKKLIELQTQLRSDVLKVGHHGSKTSTTGALLTAVQPGQAVISAGKNNQYGHPTNEVLDRLTGAGIEVLRTDQQGSITLPFNASPKNWFENIFGST